MTFAYRVSVCLSCWFLGSAQAATPATPPSLVVVIAVDQLRADYLERFKAHLEPGGFKLFTEQGAYFTDCHYRHSITKTAPGHALMLSGVHADVHGIIANDWIDRSSFLRVNSVDDDSVQLLGLSETQPSVRRPGRPAAFGCSPRNFLATTVPDELKLARGGQPKVISISSKDRSAVLLGGKLANAAYWMDQGRMISSTYYMQELPPWVQTFNDSGRVEAYFGRTWERLLPAETYAVQGADDAEGEFAGLGLARTFPKKIDGGTAQLEFARAVMEQENLGRRGVTDVLCVSFSVNDTVGHDTGPNSHEVMDITLRTDRMLADFFSYLDGRVGLKNCTLVLTSDHGVAPMPEYVKQAHPALDAGRISLPKVLAAAEEALNAEFGPLADGARWLVIDAASLLVAPAALEEKDVTRADAENVIREALRTIDFVTDIYTRTDLENGIARGKHGAGALLSFNRARSGDVFYHVKPLWIERPGTGSTHGSPYNYDTHVPLLWFGVGVTPGVRTERVGVDDLAPTLAHILGISAPAQSQGRILF
jgi:predicted AlkP superfamily pyrophosphatase or phosphodiesterase